MCGRGLTDSQPRRRTGRGKRIVASRKTRKVHLYPIVCSQRESGACGNGFHFLEMKFAHRYFRMRKALLAKHCLPQLIVKEFGSRPASSPQQPQKNTPHCQEVGSTVGKRLPILSGVRAYREPAP